MLTQLKIIRMQKGLKQYDVADAIGIKQCYLSLLENKQAVLTPEDLSRILCKLKPDMPGHPLAEKNRQLI